jgi:hypothetical protein
MHDALVQRDSVDLVAVAVDAQTVRVSHATRGSAHITRSDAPSGATRDGSRIEAHRWSYRFESGDPLALGVELHEVTGDEAWAASARGDYPDALVQLADVVPSPRAGDFVLSAAPGWDLRDRYEPTPHRSTHGALHRDQIMVPLLLDVVPSRAPQRSADVMPSVLARLGLPVPGGLDGRSFLG